MFPHDPATSSVTFLLTVQHRKRYSGRTKVIGLHVTYIHLSYSGQCVTSRAGWAAHDLTL